MEYPEIVERLVEVESQLVTLKGQNDGLRRRLNGHLLSLPAPCDHAWVVHDMGAGTWVRVCSRCHDFQSTTRCKKQHVLTVSAYTLEPDFSESDKPATPDTTDAPATTAEATEGHDTP